VIQFPPTATVLPFNTTYRPAVEPIHSPIQQVPGSSSRGEGSGDLTITLHSRCRAS